MEAKSKETAERNKEIVEKVNASFAKGSAEDFLSNCADDIRWEIVGEKTVNGREAIREFMKEMNSEPPQFTVEDVIAEGDKVAAQGNMTMPDKDGNTVPYSFCDVYRFRDGKIVELNSFVIKTGEKA
jgi:uncharacterized protein